MTQELSDRAKEILDRPKHGGKLFENCYSFDEFDVDRVFILNGEWLYDDMDDYYAVRELEEGSYIRFEGGEYLKMAIVVSPISPV